MRHGPGRPRPVAGVAGRACRARGRCALNALAGSTTALEFLRCRTPAAWIAAAVGDLDLLLQDHATLELKAAEQAQRLIRKYGSGGARSFRPGLATQLIARMARLAREELKHFERVVDHLGRRGLGYRPVAASRYAAGLHAGVRGDEPGRLVDTLLVGAVIEARSCERFASLVPALESVDAGLAAFYRSLLRSEARHYADYLELARAAAALDPGTPLESRLDAFLDRDRELVLGADTELRFHSGVPSRP